MLDWPKPELGPAPGWDIALEAFADGRARNRREGAVVATVPECLSEARAERLVAEQIAPMQGLAN